MGVGKYCFSLSVCKVNEKSSEVRKNLMILPLSSACLPKMMYFCIRIVLLIILADIETTTKTI